MGTMKKRGFIELADIAAQVNAAWPHGAPWEQYLTREGVASVQPVVQQTLEYAKAVPRAGAKVLRPVGHAVSKGLRPVMDPITRAVGPAVEPVTKPAAGAFRRFHQRLFDFLQRHRARKALLRSVKLSSLVKHAAFVAALEKWAAGVETIKFVNMNSVDGDVVRVMAEVARGDFELRRGLMGREHLPDGQGMLFEFPDVQRRSFWMRNVPIPLDMVFVKVDGTISNIEHSAEPYSDTPHPSTDPVRYVVELPGGFCKRHGIEAGWKMVRGG